MMMMMMMICQILFQNFGKIALYFPNYSATSRMRHKVNFILNGVELIWIHRFPSLGLIALSKLKITVYSKRYSPIGRYSGIYVFLMVLARSELLSAQPKIWTLVSNSILYGHSRYSTSTFQDNRIIMWNVMPDEKIVLLQIKKLFVKYYL